MLLTMLLGSCRKTCTCIDYHGRERTYTADEVEEQGASCANMVFQAGVQYYSVCDWD